MPQYLNTLPVATEMTIPDTGATLIFVMDGASAKNKQPAKNPLTINLPDGRQVKSTHVCDINILGIPAILKGHIVPNLAVASLFGIHVLCKAGCTVVFNDKTCSVYFNSLTPMVVYKTCEDIAMRARTIRAEATR